MRWFGGNAGGDYVKKKSKRPPTLVASAACAQVGSGGPRPARNHGWRYGSAALRSKVSRPALSAVNVPVALGWIAMSALAPFCTATTL